MQDKMVRYTVPIAGNYVMNGEMGRLAQDFVNGQVFTYKTKAPSRESTEIQVTQDLRDSLNYVLYSDDIASLVKRNQTGAQLQDGMIADIARRQTISGKYVSSHKLAQTAMLEGAAAGTLQDALVTVTDTETVSQLDPSGQLHKWIYQAAFEHRHFGNTVGNFKGQDREFQNFYIGLYDQKQIDFLEQIKDKVKKPGGFKNLDDQEMQAFDYFSHIGASLNDVNDLMNKTADQIQLTSAEPEIYRTLENYEKAQKAFKHLGTKQVAEGTAKGYTGLSSGIMQLADNLAEVIVNGDSMIMGWNGDYDMAVNMEAILTTPGAEKYLQDRITDLQKQATGGQKLTANAGLQTLRWKSLDPFQEGVQVATNAAVREANHDIYGNRMRSITEDMGAWKFENIAPGMASRFGVSDAAAQIYGATHHDAGIDTLQESLYLFDANGPHRKISQDILQRAIGNNTYDPSLGVKGVLFQAQTSGSMANIQQYNKNVFAVVTSPGTIPGDPRTGDMFMSNGWKWSSELGDYTRSTQFAPGAWAQNATYQLKGIAQVGKDTDLAKHISQWNSYLAGEDLTRIDFKLALLDPLQQHSEAGQEIHSVYMPASQAEQFIGNNFLMIGRLDQRGNPILNELGIERAQHLKATYDNLSFYSPAKPEFVYAHINRQRIMDRAERSFNKYSVATNENVFALKDIAKQGNFAKGANYVNRLAQLQDAIVQASTRQPGSMDALNQILQGTNIQESAEAIVKRFSYEDKFNQKWLANASTIAYTIEEGSLYEQMHRSAMALLNTKEFQNAIGTGEYAAANRNALYRSMMSGLMEYAYDQAPEHIRTSWNKGNNRMGRFVDDIGKFYLNAADFTVGYRSEFHVPSINEDPSKYWLKIDLENPSFTVSSIKKAAGLKGKRAENPREVRKALVSFMDYMTNNQDVEQTVRDEFKGLFNADLASKGNYQIAQDIIDVFSRAKRTRGQGWAPEALYRPMESFATQWKPDKPVKWLSQDIIEKEAYRIGKEQTKMLGNYTVKRDEVARRVQRFMFGDNLKGGRAEYEKILQGFDTEAREAMLAIYDENSKAIQNYTESLIKSLEHSGVNLSVGDTFIKATYGTETRDLSALIPKLQSNTTGIMSWMVGAKNTQYIAAPTLHWNMKTGLSLGSNLDYALDEQWLKNAVTNAIRNGEDPLDAIERVLRRPNKILREIPLYEGSPTSDWRNLVSANTAPILNDLETIDNIVAYGNKIPLNDIQKQAIKDLENYANSWHRNGTQPLVGVEPTSALINLTMGEGALISPVVKANKTNLRLNAGAKQTSTEGVRFMITPSVSHLEGHVDPGKLLANQVDNALYYREELSAAQQEILKPIHNFGMGPLAATQSELKLSRITDKSGLKMTNRIRAHVLEADDFVKQDLYQQLVDEFGGDDTVAKNFARSYMPYEGGGWVNGRLWDTMPRTNTWQTLNLTPHTAMWGNEKWKENFAKNAELRFNDPKSGKFKFKGYGRGVFVKKGDALYHTYDTYNQTYRAVEAKADSIMSVVYTTNDGRNIVDEDTLRKTVGERLKQLGQEENRDNWIAVADSMYQRKVVARRVFDEGVAKVVGISEKHESLSGIRAISEYYSGSGTMTWQKEEQLLHDILYSKEFDAIAKDMGTDFRKGKILTSEMYQDLAHMRFQSPIYRNRTHRESAKAVIQGKMANFLGLDVNNLSTADQRKIEQEFYRIMDEARYRTSDAIKRMTNADAMAVGIKTAAKHGNQIEMVNATISYLEKQMQKNKAVSALTKQQEDADRKKAVDIFNLTGALKDKDGNVIQLGFDNGTIIYPTNNFTINEKELLKAYGYDGNTIVDISEEEQRKRMGKMFSEIRDMEVDPITGKNIYRASLADFTIERDIVGSDKLYKITDREIVSYSNVLLDEDVLRRVKAGMNDDAAYRSVFGRFLDTNGDIKKDMIGTPMYQEERRQLFKDFGYMRYQNGSLFGEELYDETKTYAMSPYRQEKTKDLVTRLKRGRDNVFVAQSYADDLYEYASLQQANAYNLGNLSLSDLVTDRGQIDVNDLPNKQFFKQRHIGEILTGTDHAKDVRLSGMDDIFSDNLVIDLTDAKMGLNDTNLKYTQIALAGIDNSTNPDDLAPTEFQRSIQRLQRKYEDMQTMEVGSDEFNKALTDYNRIAEETVKLHQAYAENKVKTGKPARLQSTRVAASLNNKVQDMYTGQVAGGWDSMEAMLGNRTYNGKSLVDLYKSNKSPNFAIIAEADLEKMGFNDEYFKSIGISKEKWLQKARTEGISGSAHRWPTDYLGSTMAVQIYVDENGKAGHTVYDDITAAFLKADSDGDMAQIMIDGATDSYVNKHGVTKGRFVDSLSHQMGASNISQAAQDALTLRKKNHDIRMMVQMHDTNNMVVAATQYRELVSKTRDDYINAVMKGKGDIVGKFMADNVSHIDLSGNAINAVQMRALTQAERNQYLQDFEQYRTQITDALDKIGAPDGVKARFSNTDTVKAIGALQNDIAQDRSLGEKLYKQLGSEAETINTAFRNAASVEDTRKVALQRAARKGVGQSDMPFQVVETFREHAIMSGRNVINNDENVAMYLLKEMDKEQLLTTKQMADGAIVSVEDNLKELHNLMNRIIQNNGSDTALRDDFITFMKNTARDPNKRYMPESLLENFAVKDAKTGQEIIDVEKLWGSAFDGIAKSVKDMDENTDILNSVKRNVSYLARLGKAREAGVFLNLENWASDVGNAISGSNRYEDRSAQIAANMQQRKAAIQRGQVLAAKASKNTVQKTIRDFRPGRNLAISALGLAAAAVFGGYAGGNPSEPAQQQAQNIQEQEPPRNITMADPGLTASSRKQPGYVININAQTERDKAYASRIITQAVTKNFQDTNVNVSMNVNQQPGNISGNDLLDYLSQAL